MSEQWTVERWGGQARHKTRVVFIGSEDLARAKFEELGKQIRQGVVRLYRGSELMAGIRGFRARTRLA